MFKRFLPVGLSVAALVLVIAPSATAKEPPAKDYCVVHVVGQKASGEFELSKPECYSTLVSSLDAEAAGWQAAGGARNPTQLGILSSGIGIHCDGFYLGGPCLTVVGDGCTGGFINLDATWNNRISSTQHGCPLIRHHNGSNLTGTYETTSGAYPAAHNLTTLNNQTSSIVYYY